jgi:hypothetical protein
MCIENQTPKGASNMAKKANRKSKSAVKRTKKKVAKKNQFPRAEGNPFREKSSYGVAFDILAKHKEGLPRQKLIELLATATGKSTTKASFDVSVILSAKQSPTGPRHRSCREGFWIQRETDHCTLRAA